MGKKSFLRLFFLCSLTLLNKLGQRYVSACSVVRNSNCKNSTFFNGVLSSLLPWSSIIPPLLMVITHNHDSGVSLPPASPICTGRAASVPLCLPRIINFLQPGHRHSSVCPYAFILDQHHGFPLVNPFSSSSSLVCVASLLCLTRQLLPTILSLPPLLHFFLHLLPLIRWQDGMLATFLDGWRNRAV